MNDKRRSDYSRVIKRIAEALGFDACGIAEAKKMDDDARRLEQWLQNGYHGSMHYMERHFDLRVDPTLLVPGARSVITLLYNYFPNSSAIPQTEHGPELNPRISKYAFGKDYHLVIRKKLKTFLQQIETEVGQVIGRGFVDSAPVLERSWAQKSGLGWIGKNGNLIDKKRGSFLFIATLITDLELESDAPFRSDHCGTCTRCIDACPTNAILPGPTIDGSRCISYFTIELKEKLIPANMQGKFEGWMFGCDTCQDVCPWNRFSQPTREAAFSPLPGLLNLRTKDWEEITKEAFDQLFRESPIKRTGWEGIQRNLRFIQGDNAAT